MVAEFPLITTNQFEAESKKWLEAIGRGENAAVLFIPRTDRHIRLGQLLSDDQFLDKILGHSSSYIFKILNFDPHDVEDGEDLSFQIEERLNLSKISSKTLRFEEWMRLIKDKHQTLVLILSEAEKYLMKTKGPLTAVSEIVKEYEPYIRVISLFEYDFTHPSQLEFLPSSSTLYENIFYYPLYPHKITSKFIDVLKKQWKVKIDTRTKEKIIQSCGGHFWVVKEAIRHLAATGEWSTDTEGMRFRLRSLYNLMSPTEQSVIQKLVRKELNFTPEEQLSLTYLQKMHVIDSNQQLLIGAFKEFILNQEEQQVDIVLKNNRIIINKVVVDSIFSKKEQRVMRLFLEKKGEMVSRDKIAEHIWPNNTQDHYSDWAIDQIIARLRKRLIELSLSPRLIKVVRGKGYSLSV